MVHTFKSLYLMRAAPQNMQTENWYEAIYNQWYRRETWCSVQPIPGLDEVAHKRHFP